MVETQERQAAARRPFRKNADAENVMRICFFSPSACEAPAIILIWSCPEGRYYGIYFNSPGLLHFFCTGQKEKEDKKKKKKKKFQAIRRMCWEPEPVAPRLRVVVLGAVMRILVELELTRLLWPGAHSN